MNGVGPASGGRIAAMNCSGRMLSVSLAPGSAAADTGPGGGGRFAAQLAQGRWLIAYHHGVSSYMRNASAGWDAATTPYHIEEPFNIAVSPRGDRAAVMGRDNQGTGMPVFSAASANPAYFLTGFHELWAGAFSDNGDTLFAVGVAAAGAAPFFSVLAASDGTVLKSVPAWSGTYHLLLDPAGKWIYLVGAVRDTTVASNVLLPALQVVDRATFAPVTLLQGPPGADVLRSDVYPILSPAESRLYIVATCSFCSAGTVPIFAFDLMP
jgi:hypothetical protein